MSAFNNKGINKNATLYHMEEKNIFSALGEMLYTSIKNLVWLIWGQYDASITDHLRLFSNRLIVIFLIIVIN